MPRSFTLKDIYIITRSWSLNMTFIGITLGTVLAPAQGRVTFALYLFCLLGAMMFHAGANGLNDYFDLKNKIDSPEAPTALYRPHSVFTGLLVPHELFLLSLTFILGSLILGVIFALYVSAWIWGILVAGLFLAVFYTARPVGLKYRALGELTVFLVFGPLMVEGAYAVQACRLSARPLYLSIPFGILVALVLFANNMRDAEFDEMSGIRTLSAIIGPKRSLTCFLMLSLSAFLLIPAYIILGFLPGLSLIIFLAFPLNILLIREFTKALPVNADAKTSNMAVLFGLLLIFSLLPNLLKI